MRIPETELILNKDGSVYHLNLLPEDVADTIITVGDPDRVPKISCYFDRIDVRKQKREFVTHTGYIGSKRLTVISTGISTDNIDIVMNELDALANIDLKTRFIKPQHQSLDIIRIGTSGALQKDIPIDSHVISQRGIGLEGLAGFYNLNYSPDEQQLQKKFLAKFNFIPAIQNCYAIDGDARLIHLLSTTSKNTIIGSTVTCGGFYGPQGRILRAQPSIPHLIDLLQQLNMTNFEMETAGIYAMARLLGHHACSANLIVANRITHEFSTQYEKWMDHLIQTVLEKITQQEAVYGV